MKRLKIMKVYFIFWLFLYFLISSNFELVWVYFSATITFNVAVLTILGIGTIIILTSAFQLVNLAGTFGILAYKKDNLEFYLKGIDRIMPANIAHMFHSRAKKKMLLFTQEESREVVSWLDDKFANQKAYINFFIGTALMIGLFGTFTGLLKAIDDMGRIILSLSGDINIAEVISQFAGPLGGMAIGFGSSLFGVAAAIVLGIKGYILSRNQEKFIVGVEDWLKGRIIEKGTSSEGGALPGNKDGQGGFMDHFLDKISQLSQDIKTLNETNEQMRLDIATSLVENTQISRESIDTLKELNQHIGKLSMEKTESILEGVSNKLGDMDSKMNLQTEIIEDISELNKRRSKDLHSQIDIINETLESVDDGIAKGSEEIVGSIKGAPIEKEPVRESKTQNKPVTERGTKKVEGESKYNDLFKD